MPKEKRHLRRDEFKVDFVRERQITFADLTDIPIPFAIPYAYEKDGEKKEETKDNEPTKTPPANPEKASTS